MWYLLGNNIRTLVSMFYLNLVTNLRQICQTDVREIKAHLIYN